MKTCFPSLWWTFRWVAAALLLSGCADHEGEGPTTVSGQVVESTNRQPVPRPPQVQLWQRAQSTGSLTGGAAYAPVGSPQPTDGQGRFTFTFEAKARQEYVLRAADAGLGYYGAATARRGPGLDSPRPRRRAASEPGLDVFFGLWRGRARTAVPPRYIGGVSLSGGPRKFYLLAHNLRKRARNHGSTLVYTASPRYTTCSHCLLATR